MKQVLLLFAGIAITGTAAAQALSEHGLAAFSNSYSAEAGKDYSKAISALQPVYNENFYEVNLRLGWLSYENKDYDGATKYYRQAVKLRPASIEALFGLVNPDAALKNWAEVFTSYQKILTLDPQNSLANYRIALMYYYRKEFAAAEKCLQKVVDHYPFDYDSILLMAQVKLAQGKLAESKSYYQRALIYNPSNSEIKSVLSKL